MKIIPANTASQFNAIEKLAFEIMPDHYRQHIPVKNIMYFLDKFQTAKAIENQVRNQDFEYYLLNVEGTDAGYLGIQIADNILTLNKLYILKQFRGKGIGHEAMKFVNEKALRSNVSAIELIVNQYYHETIAFYKKRGYVISESFTHNYDNVYSTEEYKMVKQFI